jgi:hypothetical protein
MTAYTEENFNKLLDEYSEMKQRMGVIARSFIMVSQELMEKHNYSVDDMTRLIQSDNDILD